MQNLQNTAEIQQRVINLVELYRKKVGKESQIAKAAKADHEFWEKESIDMIIGEGLAVDGSIYGTGSHTDIWIKHLMVNEQLLGHFYSVVTGENAEKDILDQLLPDIYDKTIFSEEEEAFLASHFKELVNYIILTPCDESLGWVNRNDFKDIDTIPKEVLELIKSRIEISAGSKVYYPNTTFAQLANLYEGCKYYCDTMSYAWTRLAIYANSVSVEDFDSEVMSLTYDAIISYLPEISGDSNVIKHICKAYSNLSFGGKLILLCPSTFLVDEAYTSYKKMLVEDRAIKEIIQLPQVMSNNAPHEDYCLLIAEKGYHENKVTLIDARTASNDLDTKHYMFSFNIAKFTTILKNDGRDPITGLRKVVMMSPKDLSHDILVPKVYTIERPSITENPVPMSSLCTLESTLVRDIQYNLPEDTPWITMSDLTPLFTGDLDMSGIRKADCPNNPLFIEGSKDYAFDKDGKFVDSIWEQIYTAKGFHVLEYRLCTYLDGNCDAVLYERDPEYGVHIALVRATGKPFAVSKGIMVFCPKDGFETTSLVALLRLPIVYRQLLTFEEYGIGSYLDKILVPKDKRIICDEIRRMKKEETCVNEFGEKVEAMKAEYIDEVRMRKHDMRPYLRQISSAERLIRHYIKDTKNDEDFESHLNIQLARIHDSITHLSDIVEHLSEEEQFGTPELFIMDWYFQDLISESINSGIRIEYTKNTEKLKQFIMPKIVKWMDDIKTGIVKETTDENGEKGYELPYRFSQVYISPLDFSRLVLNIIENARIHGFTDLTRSDYKIMINLSVDEKREMYQIDFTNNGTPLPNGMTKTRYGIKGEKAGLSGGTGTGGYIVKSIVNHDGGDYDVFCNDGLTTIRIFLPIATI